MACSMVILGQKEYWNNSFVDENNPLTNSLVVLKAQFMILSEGILNSNTDDNKRKLDIDYSGIHISDCYNLTKELTKLTGFKFSITLDKQSW